MGKILLVSEALSPFRESPSALGDSRDLYRSVHQGFGKCAVIIPIQPIFKNYPIQKLNTKANISTGGYGLFLNKDLALNRLRKNQIIFNNLT